MQVLVHVEEKDVRLGVDVWSRNISGGKGATQVLRGGDPLAHQLDVRSHLQGISQEGGHKVSHEEAVSVGEVVVVLVFDDVVDVLAVVREDVLHEGPEHSVHLRLAHSIRDLLVVHIRVTCQTKGGGGMLCEGNK